MKHLFITLFIFTIIYSQFTIPLSHAATPPGPVPQIGQTACYNSSGAVIPCSGTAQDRAITIGTAWPNSRFTENSHTTTGNMTGLMRTKDASSSITTTFAGTYYLSTIGGGNMFDVKALSTGLSITGFDLNINSKAGVVVPVKIYYKSGTYIGSETSQSAWTLLNSYSVTSAGAGTASHVTVSGLTIPAGQTCGIFITPADGTTSLVFSPGSGSYATGDANLTLGIATAYNFSGFTSSNQYTWNGTIYYTTGSSSDIYLLSAQKSGTGSGSITSSPAGISCGKVCSTNYISGTSVVLSATPAGGSTFDGWSGACSGTGICTVTMNEAKIVEAVFNLAPVNGSCGSSNGQTFTVAPTANLCATGDASAVSGNGPWSWTCSGINGGSTAGCQSNVQSATAKKALLIVRDYNEQPQFRQYFESEAATIAGYLTEIGMSTEIVYGFATPLVTMQNYDLVLFNDMGWTENVPASLINDLVSYHKTGKPLYFIGDDLAYNYYSSGGKYNNDDYYNLIGLMPSSDNGFSTINSTVVPVYNLNALLGGQYGTVASFVYLKDIDNTKAKSFAIPLMTYNGNDAFVIYQDQYGKVASQNYNIYASDIIIADAAGLVEIGKLFKKTVSWLTSTPTAILPIIWQHQGDGKVYGMTTNGNSITGGSQFWQEGNTAWSIVGQGDFDGDGVRDLVWRNSSTGQVYIMFMTSPMAVKSGAAIYTEPNTAWKIVATGEINGDGKTDLIWWNSTTGQVYAMLINGTSIVGGGLIYTEPNTNWKIVAVADFNGNGKAELLWWNSSTGQVAIGQTNGTGASTANLIWTEPNTDWRIAGAGDLDGDGKADIIWHNRTTGQVYGMQTNGSAVTNGAMMYTEPNTNWEIVSVGTYNSDNKADLLWWNQLTGQIYLMPMNGLSVAPGGALLHTEPDTTWHIQGETEWRDRVYGTGITTTSSTLAGPTITAFTLPSLSTSLTVTISSFTASRDATGYYVSESSTTPGATAAGWTTSAPASFTFTSTGSKTLYAWVKNSTGSISTVKSATVTIIPTSYQGPATKLILSQTNLDAVTSGAYHNTKSAFMFALLPTYIDFQYYFLSSASSFILNGAVSGTKKVTITPVTATSTQYVVTTEYSNFTDYKDGIVFNGKTVVTMTAPTLEIVKGTIVFTNLNLSNLLIFNGTASFVSENSFFKNTISFDTLDLLNISTEPPRYRRLQNYGVIYTMNSSGIAADIAVGPTQLTPATEARFYMSEYGYVTVSKGTINRAYTTNLSGTMTVQDSASNYGVITITQNSSSASYICQLVNSDGKTVIYTTGSQPWDGF